MVFVLSILSNADFYKDENILSAYFCLDIMLMYTLIKQTYKTRIVVGIYGAVTDNEILCSIEIPLYSRVMHIMN